METFVEVPNCHNFTTFGNESVSISHDGLPQPTSWIECSPASRSRRGLIFINSSAINIYNLGLDSCGGNVNLGHNFSVYVALAFDQVDDLVLQQEVKNNTIGFGLHCDNVW